MAVNHNCHPERSEGPLRQQERSLAALGMTAGLYQAASDQLMPCTENTEISNITRTSPAFA
jgi:hypothetical protein